MKKIIFVCILSFCSFIVYNNILFASLPPASPWGVVAVWPYGLSSLNSDWEPSLWRSSYTPQLDSMISCGLSWDRPNCGPNIPPYNGFDSLVVFAQERGINLLPCIAPPSVEKKSWGINTTNSSIPRGNQGNTNNETKGLDSQEVTDYWYHTVGRYSGYGNNNMPGLTKPIKYWEIINEPYITDSTINDFCDYVRLSSEAIHTTDSSAKVVGPTMGAMENGDDTLLRNVLSLCANYFDVISIHCYTYGDFSYLDTAIKPVLDKYAPGKPVWITETGCNHVHPALNLLNDSIYPDSVFWHNSDTITEAKQAEYLVDWCNAKEQRPWISKIFLFSLQDFWYYAHLDSTHTGIDYWGMLREDYTHRPAFDSVRNFIFSHLDIIPDSEWLVSDVNYATGYNNQRHLVRDNNNGNLHLVFTSRNEIRYAMSSDNGVTWSNKFIVGEGQYPAIAIDTSGGVNVCWVDNGKVKFRRKDGSVWGNVVTVAPLLIPSYTSIAPPCIAIGNNDTVHIIVEHWTGEGGGFQTVYVDHCEFALSNYPNNIKLGTVTPTPLDNWQQWTGPLLSPSISLYGNDPHICWEQVTGKPLQDGGSGVKQDIYYRYRLNGTWYPDNPFLVSDGTGISAHSNVDAHDGYVRIVYEKSNNIYVRGTRDTGDYTDWKTEGNISNTSYSCISPQVYGALVVWSENTGSNYEIYYSGGRFWGAGSLSNTSVDSKYPQIAVGSSIIGIPYFNPMTLYCAYTEGNASPYEIKIGSKSSKIIQLPDHIVQDYIVKKGTVVMALNNITVDPNITLTVEPGAKLCFGEGDRLIVNGKLVAMGTETDSIRFTSADSLNSVGNQWYGIVFSGSGADSSVIDHSVIEYATWGISCNHSSPVIQHNLIWKNYAGMPHGPSPFMNDSGGGIWCDHSHATISYNTIIENA